MKEFFEKYTAEIVLIGVIGTWFTVVGFFIATFVETKKNRWICFFISIAVSVIILLLFFEQIELNLILLALVLGFGASTIIAFRKLKPNYTTIQTQIKELASLTTTIENLNSEKQTLINEYEAKLKNIIKPTSIFDRFETLKRKRNLTYGFIHYKPFFWKENMNHKGIGYDVLTQILGVEIKLTPYSYPVGKDSGNWDDIFTDLCNRKFDIIITPLFETRTRIYKYNVVYCSPLFYSNIGIYVRKKDFTQARMSFTEAISFLKLKMNKPSEWMPEILKGELSESLVKKYELSNNSTDENFDVLRPATEDDFVKVLQKVNSDHRNSGDFAFMEVFKANSIINSLKQTGENLELENILKDNELMYPVSFVVRKEDTVLRNLINIRLIEMRNIVDKDGISELEHVIRRIATSDAVQIPEENFREIFIQKFDFANLK